MGEEKRNMSILGQVVVAFGIFSVMLLVLNQINKQRSAKYHEIEESDEICCTVNSVVKKKGFSYITSNRKDSFFLHSSQNRNSTEEYLSENIFEGDSIAKRAGSDTIEIFRGSQKLLFVHKQVIK